jgi:hypothetical protein
MINHTHEIIDLALGFGDVTGILSITSVVKNEEDKYSNSLAIKLSKEEAAILSQKFLNYAGGTCRSSATPNSDKNPDALVSLVRQIAD